MKSNRFFCFVYNLKSIFFVWFLFISFVFGSFLMNPTYVMAETQAEKEARLEKELAQVEKEQKEVEAFLTKTKSQSSSLERDISILTAQIKSAQLKIKEKNLVIEKLSKDITIKNSEIKNLSERIEEGKESLAQMFRKYNQLKDYSMSELALLDDGFSSFFSAVDEYDQLNGEIQDLFVEIRQNKTDTESARNTLDKKKNSETDARAVIEMERRTIEKKEKEKADLLNISKSQEKNYSNLLAEKRKKAAEIRAALFELRDTQAIPFEVALEYANQASVKTGVRPAFLLAILMQESSFGKNVGSCYLADPETGSGVGVNSGNILARVMHPQRDVQPFLRITKDLGLDPYRTLVSCPQSIGWGGAMGPAQFIASTWALFESRLSSSLGVKVPNPWIPKHAFFASAMYLSDLGAISGSYTGERNAACRYYSGSACKVGSINSTYGNQVMAKAQNIQENMINVILGI